MVSNPNVHGLVLILPRAVCCLTLYLILVMDVGSPTGVHAVIPGLALAWRLGMEVKCMLC
jgi:hypothetical protein